MTNPDNVGGLLPCPFCGHDDSLYIEHVEGTIRHPAYYVRCDYCGAQNGSTDSGEHVKKWNERAELCRAAPAGGVPESLVKWERDYDDTHLAPYCREDVKRILADWRASIDAPAGSGEVTDGCTESNCERCATAPHARGELRHAGIGSYPDVTHIADKAAWLERAASKWEVGPMAINPADALRLRELAALLRKLQQGAEHG